VTAKSSAEAEKVLRDAGLEPLLAESPRADVPKGQVYGQVPKAGTEVALGATVAVGVSSGPLQAVQLPTTLPATESVPATP